MAIYRKGIDDEESLMKKAEAQAAARNATSSKQLRKRGLTKGENAYSSSNSIDVSRATVSKNGKHLEIEGYDRKNSKSPLKKTKTKMPISASTVNKMKQREKMSKELDRDALIASGKGVIKAGKVVKGSAAFKREFENRKNKEKK